MSFGQAIAAGFKNYANFTGVARRSEFWFFYLFYALVLAAARILDVAVYGADLNSSSEMSPSDGFIFSALVGVALITPVIGVTIRRLRDANYGWAHIFWYFLGPIGFAIIAWLCSQPSKHPSEAQYNQELKQ